MTHVRAGASMIDLVAGEAGVARLKAHGVALGKITTRFGAEGNGVSIYLTDPEGNQVELKGPSDGKAPPP